MREGIGSACRAELTRKADHHHTRQQELQVLCSGYYNSTQFSQISMRAWQSQLWFSIKLWHGIMHDKESSHIRVSKITTFS
jgi:hypothetical protein